MGLTIEIADFVVNAQASDVPERAMAAARLSLVDGLGITLGGVTEQVSKAIYAFVESTGATGSSTMLGTRARTAGPLAALYNGVAADALSLSETSGQVQHHPTIAVLAAAWAAAELVDARGEDVVLGHILGVEVASKLGRAVQPQLNIRGWHPVSILGAFGATAATSRILGFDRDQTANALGIAGMNASGTKSAMGTMTKSYSRGRAAENGMAAAILTQLGMSGPKDFLEASDGFLAVFGDGADGSAVVSTLGNPFEYDSPGLTLKPFPSCTCSHPAITALRRIKASHGVTADDVARIECRVTPTVLHYLRFPEPSSTLEAKYSMQFCCAVALMDQVVSLDSFGARRTSDGRVRELMRRVHMTPWAELAAEGFNPAERPYATEVTVVTFDGTEIVERQEQAPWGPATPPSVDALWDKYRTCVSRALDPIKADESFQRALKLSEEDSVRRFTADLLCP